MMNAGGEGRCQRLPPLTREQVREVDRMASEQFGVPSIVLMENAGRAVADTLEALGIGGRVIIACGRGNNAGDGLVVARHLDLRGYQVHLLMVGSPDLLSGDALTNWQIILRSGIDVREVDRVTSNNSWHDALEGAEWLVDALLGTGARGAPRSPMDEVIRVLNDHPARRLAVDVPSGLDCDTGEVTEPTFRADHTCTFVAPKPALVMAACAPWVGQLHILDIGAPRALLERWNGSSAG